MNAPAGAITARPPPAGSYYDPALDTDVIKLLPADWKVSSDEVALATVLGSCVAACIYDPLVKLGGMNHFMLPDNGGGASDSGRYGSYAMELLINEMMKKGASRMTLEAKVFGGGAVISGMNSINVGERNTAFVMDYLKTERIPVVSKDVLEIYPRKVCFFPASGKAMVKRLAPANPDALVAQDRAAAKRVLPQNTGGGSVDLF